MRRIVLVGSKNSGKSRLFDVILISQKNGTLKSFDFKLEPRMALNGTNRSKIASNIPLEIGDDELQPREIELRLKKNEILLSDPFVSNIFHASSAQAIANAICMIWCVDATDEEQSQQEVQEILFPLNAAYHMGVQKLVIAITQMDKVNYDREIYSLVVDKTMKLLEQEQTIFSDYHLIPISIDVKTGDTHNIFNLSTRIPWYNGLPLLNIIEDVTTKQFQSVIKRMFIKRTYKMPSENQCLLCVDSVQGISKGDTITVYPEGLCATVYEVAEQHSERNGIIRIQLKDENRFRYDPTMIIKGDILPSVTRSASAILLCKGSIFEQYKITSRTHLGDVECELQQKRKLNAIQDWELVQADIKYKSDVILDSATVESPLNRISLRSIDSIGEIPVGFGIILDHGKNINIANAFHGYWSSKKFGKGSEKKKGNALENLINLIFQKEGFRTKMNLVTAAEEEDILVYNYRKDDIWEILGERICIECKNINKKSGAEILYKLAGKMYLNKYTSAILVSPLDITGTIKSSAKLLQREFMQHRILMLVLSDNELNMIESDKSTLTNILRTCYEKIPI